MWYIYTMVSTIVSLALGKSYTISHPFFADADTGIYVHRASEYHANCPANYVSKQGVTNLSHAQTMFVTFC